MASSASSSAPLDRLRKPFLIVAGVLALLVVLLELGSGLLADLPGADPAFMAAAVEDQLRGQDGVDRDAVIEGMAELREDAEPPGIAIKASALLDGLVLYVLLLLVLSLVISKPLQGRLQGVVTLVVSLLMAIASFVALLVSIGLTMLMLGLFMAAPFGTLAYLALYGFFDTSGAAITLGFIMFLKLGGVVCLLLAQQRFLKSKSLVLLLLTSLLCTLIIGFLHALVPGILVSITDAIGAIVAALLALIWAIVFLISSVFAIIKAIV